MSGVRAPAAGPCFPARFVSAFAAAAHILAIFFGILTRLCPGSSSTRLFLRAALEQRWRPAPAPWTVCDDARLQAVCATTGLYATSIAVCCSLAGPAHAGHSEHAAQRSQRQLTIPSGQGSTACLGSSSTAASASSGGCKLASFAIVFRCPGSLVNLCGRRLCLATVGSARFVQGAV
jgi:hypothetical protein